MPNPFTVYDVAYPSLRQAVIQLEKDYDHIWRQLKRGLTPEQAFDSVSLKQLKSAATADLKYCRRCECSQPTSEFPPGRWVCHTCKRLAKYGIQLQTFKALLEKQGGECAICQTKLLSKFCIDHNHDTGTVRGLLCYSCNNGLGMFNDSTFSLLKAVEYLNT